MYIDGLSELSPEGSGGFSQVFRAIQTRYDRVVAAKVLKFRLDAQADRDRFESECRAMGQLSDHPHIVPLYSTNYTDEGFPVIVMEFFAGGTLADRARRGLSEADVLDIGVKIASALHCAHDRGVIHRDVKPQNVLLSRFGEPALTDFGISAIVARKAGSGRSTGITLAYAAPEALDGEVTSLTDVYSLAATLYTVLAGQRPFDEPGTKLRTNDLVRRILHEEPPPLQTFGHSADLDAVVRVAGMAKDPGRRPQSAREFGDLLRGLQRKAGYDVTPWIEARDLTDASLPTVDGSDESITIVRRHNLVAPTETNDTPVEPAPTGSRQRQLIALALAVLVIGGLLLAILLSGGRDDDVAEPTIDATPDAIPTLDPLFERAIFAPTDVTLERTDDGAVVVRWEDPNESPVTFEVQRVDVEGADAPLLTTQETSIELEQVGDTEAPCITMRALGELGQQSPDIPAPMCLPAKLGDAPVMAVVPAACEPGACDFRLDASGYIAGTTVVVVVEDDDGVDLNSLFGEAYAPRAAVLENGVIDWRFSPGSSAPTGTYKVTVIDEQTGQSSISFFDLIES